MDVILAKQEVRGSVGQIAEIGQEVTTQSVFTGSSCVCACVWEELPTLHRPAPVIDIYMMFMYSYSVLDAVV